MRIFHALQQLFTADHQTFAVGVYRQFLNRQLDGEDLTVLVNDLLAGGARIDVLKNIVISPAFEQLLAGVPRLSVIESLQEVMCKNDYEFVKRLYTVLFGMEPKLTQIQHGVDLLHAGASKADVLQDLMLSEEMMIRLSQAQLEQGNKLRCSIANTLVYILGIDEHDFITVLYRELLGCNPEQQEFIVFSKALRTGMSRTDLYKMIIQGNRFAGLAQSVTSQKCMGILRELMEITDEDVFVTEIYRECLDRDPDPAGLATYVYRLETGTPRPEIIRSVLVSDEAANLYYLARDEKPRQVRVANLSQLWPNAPLSNCFRTSVKQLLRQRNFPDSTSLLVKTGGLGDCVQMTAVAKALKTKEPNRPIIAVVGDNSSLFDQHPYIDAAIELRYRNGLELIGSVIGLTENVFDLYYVSCAYGTWQNSDFFWNTIWYYQHFPQSGTRLDEFNMHVCDLMLYSLGLEQYANCNDVYINPDEVPEKIPGDYVIVCDSAGSAQGALKRWSAEGWSQLINWLHLRGIIPVQLGPATEELLHPRVMDLRGKTTPRQAAGYLKLSKGYIGIEGGLFHLSKAAGAPAVVIFASTSATCFAYPDTRVVTRRQCRPCWWTDTWIQAECLRGCKSCLNLPDWESVAAEVSKMLS
ncbi:hypothetical protein AXX12_01220 [Anaerosporomusa subterranea]|uniref:DUF4214 domain-containing protein n=1 Tax=Anaerosporomusa subterranea TaxID=1794912 RepID=A0A154BVY9_ANASB|nr:DUF4214 domain-containing protein [Anaerosporomusa subterranea]KYZ78194.1 hypothetical protein AXX12_01220 [Anaerosporomusa subterranea]